MDKNGEPAEDPVQVAVPGEGQTANKTGDSQEVVVKLVVCDQEADGGQEKNNADNLQGFYLSTDTNSRDQIRREIDLTRKL